MKKDIDKYGEAQWYNAAWFAAKTTYYDSVNFLTFNAFNRIGEAEELYLNGTMTLDQYKYVRNTVVASTIGSYMIGGGAAGAVIKKLGTDVLGHAGAGAAFDITYQVIDNLGQSQIYQYTNGIQGRPFDLSNFSMTSLALNTAFGAGIGLGVIGHQWLSTRVDGAKKIYKLNTIDAPYPSVAVMSTAQKIKEKFASSVLADTTGLQVLRNTDGTRFKIKDSAQVLEVSGLGQQTSITAAEYAEKYGYFLKNNINKELSSYEQLRQALKLHNDFIAASRNSILDTRVIRYLNDEYPLEMNVDDLIKIYQNDINFKNKAGEKLHLAIIDDLFEPKHLKEQLEFKSTCFAKGTLVHTNKGLVPIQELKVGDMVLSLSENGEGETAYKRVVNTFKSVEKKELMGGLFGIFCTYDHPFWEIGRGWVPFKDMYLDGKGVFSFYNLNRNESPLDNNIRGALQVFEADEGTHDVFNLGGLYLARSGTEGVAVAYFSNNKYDYRAKDGGYLLIDFRKYSAQYILTDDNDSLLGYWKNQCRFSFELDELEQEKNQFIVLRKGRDDIEIAAYSRILQDFDLHDRNYVLCENPVNVELLQDIENRFDGAFSDYVYNIEVEDYHTYFVGEMGYWVHNTVVFQKVC